MSTQTIKHLRTIVTAMFLLAVGTIAALTIGLLAQTSASHAAQKASAAATNEAADAKKIAQLAENELARFKSFTGSVLCDLVQPIGLVVPPANVSTLGLTILHGAKHASSTLACVAPKGPAG